MGIPELVRFQEHIRHYKIVVYQRFSCEDITLKGQFESAKRFNLLYDDVERPYHVITNLSGLKANKCVCKACHETSTRETTHVCFQTVAIAWPIRCAGSPIFESRAPNATGILEPAIITTTRSKALYTDIPCGNLCVVAQRVDGS